MAVISKVFGQCKPAAGTNTELTVVPTGKQGQVSLFFSNQHATVDDKISIALVPSGDTLEDKNYITKAANLPPSTTAVFSGIGLNSGDKVIVASANGTSSFTATGLEVA